MASQGVAGVVGPRHCIEMVSGSIWKVTSQKVIILYTKPDQASGILSNAGHEESCANLPGPSGKAKYSRETDSERVL